MQAAAGSAIQKDKTNALGITGLNEPSSQASHSQLEQPVLQGQQNAHAYTNFSGQTALQDHRAVVPHSFAVGEQDMSWFYGGSQAHAMPATSYYPSVQGTANSWQAAGPAPG